MGPLRPTLSPLVRLDRDGLEWVIPVRELAAQIKDMERYGVYCLQQGLNLADELLNEDVEGYTVKLGLMNRYFSVAGAVLGAINGRANGFKFLREVQEGKHVGGDVVGYKEAKRWR